MVTGGRIKIGFEAVLILLRAGSEVIATTRFPSDAANRFAREVGGCWVLGAGCWVLGGVEWLCKITATFKLKNSKENIYKTFMQLS